MCGWLRSTSHSGSRRSSHSLGGSGSSVPPGPASRSAASSRSRSPRPSSACGSSACLPSASAGRRQGSQPRQLRRLEEAEALSASVVVASTVRIAALTRRPHSVRSTPRRSLTSSRRSRRSRSLARSSSECSALRVASSSSRASARSGASSGGSRSWAIASAEASQSAVCSARSPPRLVFRSGSCSCQGSRACRASWTSASSCRIHSRPPRTVLCQPLRKRSNSASSPATRRASSSAVKVCMFSRAAVPTWRRVRTEWPICSPLSQSG